METGKGKYYRCPQCKSDDIFLDAGGPIAEQKFKIKVELLESDE